MSIWIIGIRKLQKEKAIITESKEYFKMHDLKNMCE